MSDNGVGVVSDTYIIVSGNVRSMSGDPGFPDSITGYDMPSAFGSSCFYGKRVIVGGFNGF